MRDLEFMLVGGAARDSRCSTYKMAAPPPIYSTVQQLAQGSQANEKRYASLLEAFEAKYGGKPSHLARAPGRVNIIGEHVDYSGYGVLPMAIEQDIAIACRPNATGQLRFANVNEGSYSDHRCPVGGFEIDRKQIVWYSYVLCGVKGTIEELGIQNPVGMDVLVNGSIPPASGLSSSSALVCSAALATLCANGAELPSKRELAEMCARSERFIGTQGGGMDQAISFLGEPGKAMMIEFNPVRPTEVTLPQGYCFIISNTNVRANKAAAGSFNTRVAECHISARVMAKAKGLDWREVKKLLPLADALGLSPNEMAPVVGATLHREPYSRAEICSVLGVSDEEMARECLTEKSMDVGSFKLHDRARHVYEEAARVYEFKSTANSGGGVASSSATAEKLGRLMDESHSSCSVQYECSCEELDRLVALSKEGGALGSRLTGAGWGGCAVSLVREDDAHRFMEGLKEGYYSKCGGDISTSLFATQPGGGAAVCKL